MKISLVGSFSRNLKDEGHTNIGVYLATQLKKNHQILQLDGYHVLHRKFWKDLQSFSPDIIHFVPGATIRSFALLKLLKLYARSKTVMSLVNPRLRPLAWRLAALGKPDLILNQSYEDEETCNRLGIRTDFLPNGVDVDKFVPVKNEAKMALRKKYQIDKRKFVILHVGHLTKDRGLALLCQLNSSDNQVLIISSSYFKTNRTVLDTLDRGGCLVWRTYFENIWEIYQLADCYVFPTAKNKTILEPLSILEAMACNLPVISTKLGALPRVFEEGNGLYFAERDEDFLTLLNRVKTNNIEVKTREKVLPYTWEKVVARLEEIYSGLIGK